MVFLGLGEDAVKFVVWGLKLSGFLFKLFEGADTVFKKFVESFTFFFIPVSFLLEIF